METSVSAELDLTHAGALGARLFAPLNELRERDPIHWNEAAKCWVVTRHQDIMDALACRVPMSNVRLATPLFDVIPAEQWPERLPNLAKYSPHHITNIDPPRHTRARKLLAKAFGRPVVEGIRPFAIDKVVVLMQRLRERREVEFGQDIALELPGNVILKLLGMPEHLYGRLRVWANDVMTGLGVPHPKAEWIIAADRAFAEMTEYFIETIKDRRAKPHQPDDFVSSMVYANDPGGSLSDEDIVAYLQTVLVAGHDTTVNSMTFAVEALARHPAAWRFMYEHPALTLDSVTELMRYTAMSAAQNRRVAEDFEWHGRKLKKDDTVFLMFAAGNRDPRLYASPEELDLTRKNDLSLTFAPGVHHCIGHLLAKMQLTEFFSRLVQDFESAEVLDAKIDYAPILAFRAINSLRVRFHPRQV